MFLGATFTNSNIIQAPGESDSPVKSNVGFGEKTPMRKHPPISIGPPTVAIPKQKVMQAASGPEVNILAD